MRTFFTRIVGRTPRRGSIPCFYAGRFSDVLPAPEGAQLLRDVADWTYPEWTNCQLECPSGHYLWWYEYEGNEWTRMRVYCVPFKSQPPWDPNQIAPLPRAALQLPSTRTRR